MQEDALKLVLLALEDGSALSRKVLVLFVVQKLEARFPQASKTSIGHVVQLLYRASCFKVRDAACVHACVLVGEYVRECRSCDNKWDHSNPAEAADVKRNKRTSVCFSPQNPDCDK